MQEFIKSYLSEHGFLCEYIPEMYLENIYELFHDGKLQEVDNDIVLVHQGIYHEVCRNYDDMILCYTRAAELGNSRGMNLLWVRYRADNFEVAIGYALRAIDHQNYWWYDEVIHMCTHHNAINHIITIFNKTLNIQFNDTIVGTLIELPLTYDTLNILINIDQSKCNKYHDTFYLLP